MAFDQLDRVCLSGAFFDAITEVDAVSRVANAIDRGDGGWIVTPNVDILRLAARDSAVRAYLADATLVVADGMPLIWASRLARTPLPQRIAGSSLIWTLSAALAKSEKSIYVIGGVPEAGGRRSGAERATETLAARYPGLRVAGHHAPDFGFDERPSELELTCAEVKEAKPDLVLVGLGFPRQERLIARLRADLPAAWFLGCGAAVNFVAGDCHRAPMWMQRSGLEWLHRMAAEPRRLTSRYLLKDAPFALSLLARSSRVRFHQHPWLVRRSPARFQ